MPKNKLWFFVLFLLFISSCLIQEPKLNDSGAKESFSWLMFKPDLKNRYYNASFSFPLGLKWNFETDANVYSSPVIYNSVIYFGSSNGNAYALSLASGKMLWSFSAELPITSSPLIARENGNAYVFAASWDKNIYKLDAESGELVSKTKLEPFTGSSPLLYGDYIIIGGGKNLYALNKSTMNKIWSFETNGTVTGSPALFNNLVFIGSWDKNLYAVNLENGNLIWSFSASDAISSSPAIENGILYFGSDDGFLYALSAEDGKLTWSFKANDKVYSSPAFDESSKIAYFGSFDGNVYAARDGEELWRFYAGGKIYSSPLLTGNALFIGTETGKLYALDKETGKMLWSYDVGEAIYSSPVPAKVGEKKMILIGSKKGLYAFEEMRT